MVENAIKSIDKNLHVRRMYLKITSGEMDKISSKKQLTEGNAFIVSEKDSKDIDLYANSNVKYDLTGKLTEGTGLTRKSVVGILTRIQPDIFKQFSYNPEEFIIRATELINEQKASSIIQHITYNKLEECYDSSIFADAKLKGQMGVNVMSAERHLYDHILFDSKTEQKFAEDLESHKNEVAVYVKLPKSFYINTPVGKYSPDWAIAFEEGAVKHIYFVAETKGESNTLQFLKEQNLRGIEDAKALCAEQHFKAISTNTVKYDVVSSYEQLLDIVKN